MVNRHALRALRRAAGLTQTELARRVDIHSAHLSRIEAGQRRRPSRVLTARFAEELKVPVEALWTIDLTAARPE